MGLEQVVQEILDEAEQEARSIEASAREEAEALLQDARDEAERLVEKKAQEAENQAEDRARRIKAAAQLEGKKQRLEAQADVLASVRARVEERLSNLEDSERTQLLKALIDESGAAELGKGSKAWGLPEDKETLESYGFTYEGELDGLGGAVIENPEGTMREDLAFETVLDRVWRTSAHDIASEYLE